MTAALNAADETITALLAYPANANFTDDAGDTALIYAIQSGCPSTIWLLATETSPGLVAALEHLLPGDRKEGAGSCC